MPSREHNPAYWDRKSWDLPHVPGDVLVRCASGVDIDFPAIADVLRKYGAEYRADISHIGVVHLQVDPAKEQEFAYILSQTGLIVAEPNNLGSLNLSTNDPFFTTNAADSTKQWQLALMGCPAAWDLTTGSSSTLIADLGSGYTNNGDGPATISGASFNYVNNNTTITDQVSGAGHNSVCMNIMGATTNNNTGTAGIIWNATFLVIVIANGSGAINVLNAIAGLKLAADQGARVADCPFYISGVNSVMAAGVGYAVNAGVNIVCANPDSGQGTTPGNPFSYPGVISVTCSDINDNIGSGAKQNVSPTLCAPGVLPVTAGAQAGVYGAIGPSNGATSWAVPQVAGVVGLMLSANPNLSQAQISSCLTSTCDPGNGQTLFPDPNFGWGRVNANSAVRAGFALSRPSFLFAR